MRDKFLQNIYIQWNSNQQNTGKLSEIFYSAVSAKKVTCPIHAQYLVMFLFTKFDQKITGNLRNIYCGRNPRREMFLKVSLLQNWNNI